MSNKKDDKKIQEEILKKTVLSYEDVQNMSFETFVEWSKPYLDKKYKNEEEE